MNVSPKRWGWWGDLPGTPSPTPSSSSSQQLRGDAFPSCWHGAPHSSLHPLVYSQFVSPFTHPMLIKYQLHAGYRKTVPALGVMGGGCTDKCVIIMLCYKCTGQALEMMGSPRWGRAVREGFLEEVTPEWHL